MARTVYRQMQFTSPLLSFKRQQTSCLECLLWILWAQLNHRGRKQLLEQHSCKKGRQIHPLLPSWWVNHAVERAKNSSMASSREIPNLNPLSAQVLDQHIAGRRWRKQSFPVAMSWHVVCGLQCCWAARTRAKPKGWKQWQVGWRSHWKILGKNNKFDGSLLPSLQRGPWFPFHFKTLC